MFSNQRMVCSLPTYMRTDDFYWYTICKKILETHRSRTKSKEKREQIQIRRRYTMFHWSYWNTNSYFFNIWWSSRIWIISNIDVVSTYVPFLFGLDVWEKLILHVNNVESILCCLKTNIEIPLEGRHGQMYLLRSTEPKIVYARPQLVKLHQTFHSVHQISCTIY